LVTLPKDFVATRHPGYFWNLKEQHLYTMKVTGVLRRMKMQNPNQWNHMQSCYHISVNGQHRSLYQNSLVKLVAKNSVIPTQQLELI